MKHINKTSPVLVAGLLVLLTLLTFTTTQAGTAININKGSHPYTITKAEINNLLEYYSIEEDIPDLNITVNIFDKNDELVYSEVVCQKVYDCDERLNLLINQSDFITEIDNTKIYILTQ